MGLFIHTYLENEYKNQTNGILGNRRVCCHFCLSQLTYCTVCVTWLVDYCNFKTSSCVLKQIKSSGIWVLVARYRILKYFCSVQQHGSIVLSENRHRNAALKAVPPVLNWKKFLGKFSQASQSQREYWSISSFIISSDQTEASVSSRHSLHRSCTLSFSWSHSDLLWFNEDGVDQHISDVFVSVLQF